MSFKSFIIYENLRSIDSATFTGSYQNLGSALTQNSYIIRIVNNSNVLVTISTDGINDMDVLPANSFLLLDVGKWGLNATFPDILIGTQFMVKGAAGVGLVYLVNMYIPVE
jgi:hypothetical protein